MVELPVSVITELICSMVLAPFWAHDMTKAHLPFIGTTDASTVFGYGASVAPQNLNKIREIARLDTKTGDQVTLSDGVADDGKQCRLGQPHQLDLGLSDFRVVLCLRAEGPDHINVKEGQAFLAYLRWLLRFRAHHGKRVVVVLVDSKVWIGAAAKGRSGSWHLNRLLRQAAALTLAAGLQLHLVFVPSAHNPADPPSRGRRCRRHELRVKKSRPLSKRHLRLQEAVARHGANQAWLDEWLSDHNLQENAVSSSPSSADASVSLRC